jgi:hypothetical protein
MSLGWVKSDRRALDVDEKSQLGTFSWLCPLNAFLGYLSSVDTLGSEILNCTYALDLERFVLKFPYETCTIKVVSKCLGGVT